MSRNLCQSACCGNVVRLADLRGKPIEFRRFSSEPPVIGTKWICPSCSTVYFAWWRDAEWSIKSHSYIRGFVIDLAYYDSFDDEPASQVKEQPNYLCLDNALDAQEVW